MKILLADDNNVERLILTRVLENLGHEVVQAENGQQAIEQFSLFNPSLVFLDVLMPDMDGYEVAVKIKESATQSWFPIVFLTSLTEAADLAKCIEVGGDDFVSKPINKIIIKAKVDAFTRIINLYQTIEEQNARLNEHREHLIQEQEAAKKVFNNIAHRGCLASDNINYHLSPMSIFNGDLMLAAELASGGMRVMLADFTGHGLPAAIGAMPTSEIFYGMTKKGFSIEDMMTEMNTRLYNVLPRGVFCCVVVADLDSIDNRIRVWNAGAPEAYLINGVTNEVRMMASNHLPLGIQSPAKFKVNCSDFSFSEKCRLIALTDGIIESHNASLEMYGENRIIDYIENHINDDNICEGLVSSAEAFCGTDEQTDDISILEAKYPKHLDKVVVEGEATANDSAGTSDAEMCLTLRGQSLNGFDPIPLLLQVMLECKELGAHRARIFTILSELYNNALDHGVLGLSSSLKESTEGFARYYQDRAEGLKALENDFVRISFDHKPLEDGGEIYFDILDSGKGFDVDKVVKRGSQKYSGRGLPLLLSLCDSLEFLEGGKRAKACYRWHVDDVVD